MKRILLLTTILALFILSSSSALAKKGESKGKGRKAGNGKIIAVDRTAEKAEVGEEKAKAEKGKTEKKKRTIAIRDPKT